MYFLGGRDRGIRTWEKWGGVGGVQESRKQDYQGGGKREK